MFSLRGGTGTSSESEIKVKIRQALAERPKRVIKDQTRRPSAVLIPLFYEHEQFHVLFTKRTELVHHHKGEISFPGGGYHPSDLHLLQTALRESQEEIGLIPSDVEVLGELDDIITRGSPYVVSPYVGAFRPAYHFTASAFEIAEILTMPIATLLKKDCREDHPEVAPDGIQFTAYVYSCGKYQIIGATARILHQFLDIYEKVDPQITA
jgi:8-oxo-dGTP pyrophosphatase MutT (NUDIX family)